MNVSMAAALLVVDAAGGSQAGSGNGEDGEGFGLAVKDAEHKHGGKRAAGKDAALRGARGKADGQPAESAKESKGSKKDAADAADGGATPADVLGRLLEATLTASLATSAPVVSDGEQHPDAAEDEAPDDGALKERIVISTVADLAGAPAVAGDKSKSVSLRVTGMETHFEPRLDGATLVEAADLPVPSKPAPVAESASAAPKPAFEEILQRLGNGRTDSERGETGGDRQSGRNEPPVRGAAARAQAETSVTAGTVREAFADRPVPQAATPSTGQIVNAQIAERIVEAFTSHSEPAAGSADASRPAAGTQLLRMSAGGSALKTLSIQLEPQDLGRVDVAMRLIDGRLQVELAASVPATAVALAGDRHGLRKILEHAGFALDDAAISIVSRDLGQGNAAPAPPAGGTDGGRQAGGSPFDRSPDGRPSGERQPSNGRPRQADEDNRNEPSGRPNSVSGSVYL